MSSSNPPERHFGYVCINCKASAFAGRRYACWLCIDYQICGNCYDSGQLDNAARASVEHKYFHPLEVHYTRNEYEFYFGGEPYVEANVPQSYKCALCESNGLTSIELYKHVSNEHHNHRDFVEYFNILHTRYVADVADPNLAQPPLPMTGATRRILASAGNSREAVAQTRRRSSSTRSEQQQQQAMSREDQQRLFANSCLNILLRTPQQLGQHLEQQQQQRQEERVQQQQQQLQQQLRRLAMNNRSDLDEASTGALTVRGTAMSLRVRRKGQGAAAVPEPKLKMPMPLPLTLPQSLSQSQLQPLQPQLFKRRRDGLVSSLSSFPGSAHGQQRSERYFSFADIMRPSFEGVVDATASSEQGTTAGVESEKTETSHRFLCQQFEKQQQEQTEEEEEQQQQEPQIEPSRIRFIEAILCSMLAHDQLFPVTLGPTHDLQQQMKPKKLFDIDACPPLRVDKVEKPLANEDMERFYRGLDNYNNWLAELTSSRHQMRSMDDPTASLMMPALPVYLSRQPTIIGIDSDSDEQDEDEDEDKEGVDDRGGQEGAATDQQLKVDKVITVNAVSLHGQEIAQSEGDVAANDEDQVTFSEVVPMDVAEDTEEETVVFIDDDDEEEDEEVEDEEEDEEDDLDDEEDDDDVDEIDDDDFNLLQSLK